jgi:hypothetical protein
VHYKLSFKTNEVLLLFPVRQQLELQPLLGLLLQQLHTLRQQVTVALRLRRIQQHQIPTVLPVR